MPARSHRAIDPAGGSFHRFQGGLGLASSGAAEAVFLAENL